MSMINLLLISLQSTQDNEGPKEEELNVSPNVNEWGAMLSAHAAAVAQEERGGPDSSNPEGVEEDEGEEEVEEEEEEEEESAQD